MPEFGWTISPTNPNAEQGGGDLVTPHKQAEDVTGPWVIFHNVDAAETNTASGVPLPFPSVPLCYLEQIVQQLRGVVPAESPAVVGGPGPAVANADYYTLPVEVQNSIQRWAGQIVKTDIGYVQVPPAEGVSPTSVEDHTDPNLEAFVREAPQQVPGAQPGTYEDVEAEEEVPVV